MKQCVTKKKKLEGYLYSHPLVGTLEHPCWKGEVNNQNSQILLRYITCVGGSNLYQSLIKTKALLFSFHSGRFLLFTKCNVKSSLQENTN